MGRPERVGPTADRILRRLASGLWTEGSSLPSSRELGEEFGVSFHTVMAAMRRLGDQGIIEVRQRRPARVRPGSQERARRMLESPAGRDRLKRLAILIVEFWNPPQRNAFYGTLVSAIQQEAASRSQEAVVVPLTLRHQVEIAERVISGGYDAAVFIAFGIEYSASLIPFHESRFPLLVFNRRLPGHPSPTVTLDDYGASQRIVKHLAELGHRNLCMVTSHDCHNEVNSTSVKGRGRTVGWADALIERGLAEHCPVPVYAPWDYDLDIYDGMFRRLLRSADRPTAIVFSHNPLAKRFLEDPEFSKLAIPEELSVAIFEPATNIPHAPGRPPLTNINIDFRRTAQCVLETAEKIAAGVPDTPTIRVPLTIDLTESVGPPPSCRTVSASAKA